MGYANLVEGNLFIIDDIENHKLLPISQEEGDQNQTQTQTLNSNYVSHQPQQQPQPKTNNNEPVQTVTDTYQNQQPDSNSQNQTQITTVTRPLKPQNQTQSNNSIRPQDSNNPSIMQAVHTVQVHDQNQNNTSQQSQQSQQNNTNNNSALSSAVNSNLIPPSPQVSSTITHKPIPLGGAAATAEQNHCNPDSTLNNKRMKMNGGKISPPGLIETIRLPGPPLPTLSSNLTTKLKDSNFTPVGKGKIVEIEKNWGYFFWSWKCHGL